MTWISHNCKTIRKEDT